MALTVTDIAAIADAAWARHVTMTTGRPMVTWEYADDMRRNNCIASVVDRLLNNSTAAEAHDRWVERMTGDGWVIGPRNDRHKRHPNLMPFDLLPEAAKAQGYLFHSIVEALRASAGQVMTEEHILEECTA